MILVGAVLVRRWEQVAVVPAVTAIWIGGLLIVTLLHLDEFDFGTIQTQIWFGAYLAYPLIGIWILVRRRADATAAHPPVPGAPLAGWVFGVAAALAAIRVREPSQPKINGLHPLTGSGSCATLPSIFAVATVLIATSCPGLPGDNRPLARTEIGCVWRLPKEQAHRGFDVLARPQ